MRHVRQVQALWLVALFGVGAHADAQDRAKGTAVVLIDDREYTITIECNDAARPEAGFSTEPGRVVREATGRDNQARLTVRPWQDTGELVVSLDRYIAWISAPASAGGVLRLEIDLSPSSTVKDGVPVTLTHEQWISGDRPAGLAGVQIEADCTQRDPEAPAYRVVRDE